MNRPKCSGYMKQFIEPVTNTVVLKCEKCGYEWVKGTWR